MVGEHQVGPFLGDHQRGRWCSEVSDGKTEASITQTGDAVHAQP
jgi:hypothetical protein